MEQKTVALTLQEWHAILAALGKFPFEQVSGVIANITRQLDEG